MRTKRLTETDKRVLAYIIEYEKENLFPPSIREMCDALGVSSPATIHVRLQKLKEFDKIKIDDRGRITIVGYRLEEDRCQEAVESGR